MSIEKGRTLKIPLEKKYVDITGSENSPYDGYNQEDCGEKLELSCRGCCTNRYPPEISIISIPALVWVKNIFGRDIRVKNKFSNFDITLAKIKQGSCPDSHPNCQLALCIKEHSRG